MIQTRERQQVDERKVYDFDYATLWMDSDELLQSVVPSVEPVGTSPELEVTAQLWSDMKGIKVTVSQGENQKEYTISFLVETDKGRKKVDCMVVSIYESCDRLS